MGHPCTSPHLAYIALVLALGGGCTAPSSTAEASFARLDYLISDGQPDYTNRYPTVVQISTPHGACSGVLIRPQLALTAAHCFCLPAVRKAGRTYRYVTSAGANEVALNCAEKAGVTTILYPQDPSGDPQPLLPRTSTLQGSVQIHPGYGFTTDGDGDVTHSRMDLAAVHLEKPLMSKIDTRLPAQEVQPQEHLVAVGYGFTTNGPPGIRHFGTNQVMDINISVGGDGMFAFRGSDARGRGAHAWKGDSGGPCFREDKQGRSWLAGIISTGRLVNGKPLSGFTSTFHHRAWIQSQIEINTR
jgi:hypothetical protein